MMPRFQHILFPIESSERSAAVKPLVTALAERFHSRLTLLNVMQIPTAWYSGFDAGCRVMIDLPDLEEAARKELHAFCPDAAVDKIVIIGDPAYEIVHFAEQNGVDLIAMPTHGYGKFRALLLGSVTAKVLHDARCPVWTAAHTEDPELAKHLLPKNIMAAVDLVSLTAALLREYAALERDFKAKLRLVHAVPSADDSLLHNMDEDFRRFLMNSARQQIAQLQTEAGTNFDVCMEAGPISKIVRAASLHHDADLVVISRGTLRETLGQLRTNAYAIIRDSPCPVLSL
jgi:nucleotide-binding universal stress UspA family protein